jgi:hypothetical protein
MQTPTPPNPPDVWEFGQAPPKPAAAQTVPAQDPLQPAAAPLVGRTVPLDVSWVDPDTGEALRWTVDLTIPTTEQQIGANQHAAQLCGGHPWESFPTEFQLWAQAYAVIGRLAQRWPETLKRALAQDDELLGLVYGQHLAHRAFFFRPNASAGEGQESKPRLAVAARFPPALVSPRKP